MADPALLQLEGAPATKPFKKVPLTTQNFFSGLVLQRSPFSSLDNRYARKYLGSRPDQLIDGLNVELTNYNTLIRRPGTSFYVPGVTPVNEPSVTGFYSFHQLTGNITVLMDTPGHVYTVSPTAYTSIFTKGPGSGQTFFQGIGNTLYFGDGVDLEAWNPSISSSTRNWGIAIGSQNSAVGPNGVGTGSNVAFNGNSWANPGNITANDGSFATVSLTSGTSGGSSGPDLPTNAFQVQTGVQVNWLSPSNIEHDDGVYATCLLPPDGATSFLYGESFGFNIPSNATITGIQATISRKASINNAFTQIADTDVHIVKNGSAGGTNHASGTPWPTTNTVATYGNSSDLWGFTWTPADINNAYFGLRLGAFETFGIQSNEAFVDYFKLTVFYTTPSSGSGATVYSDYLEGTNLSFSIPSTTTINGILVEIKGLQNSLQAGITAQLLINGNLAGTAKVTSLPGSNAFISLGGSSDLWGAGFGFGTTNSATFGVAIQANTSKTSAVTFSVDYVRITVYGTGGPTVTPTGSGTFDAINGGYQYVYAYGNSNSGHISNPTIPSNSTGNFGGTISTSALLSSGTGYAINDTGIIIQGTAFTGTYLITGVSGSAVTTYTISGAGVGYGTGVATTATGGAQPGAGVGFSINITAVTGVSYVAVPVVASTDTQVNQIHVYRTKDGGSVYYELPTSPYPNTSATLQDSNLDATLLTSIGNFWPAIPWLGNTPPPAGLVKYTYHLGRVWGVVGNYVYYSGGPDTLVGNGNESFPPANVFLFPSQVNRLVPYSSGLLVYTTDDVWIILGTSIATFYPMPFQAGVGLLSYNALDVQGTNHFLYTSDRQFLSLSSGGYNELGYAIGNFLEANFDPSLVYVAAIVAGTSEKAVYISDGSSTWFRCNWNQPPEGGPAWSPRAVVPAAVGTLAGGAQALSSIETSPGVHQLLFGFTNAGQSAIGYRNLNTYTDASVGAYSSCFFTIGSLVLALPGQLAEIESIVLENTATGSVPSVSILTDEISGTFESLPNFVNDPPELTPSTSVMSNRWYLAQGPNAARLRHMQIRIDYNQDTVRNELLTLSVFGGLIHQS